MNVTSPLLWSVRMSVGLVNASNLHLTSVAERVAREQNDQRRDRYATPYTPSGSVPWLVTSVRLTLTPYTRLRRSRTEGEWSGPWSGDDGDRPDKETASGRSFHRHPPRSPLISSRRRLGSLRSRSPPSFVTSCLTRFTRLCLPLVVPPSFTGLRPLSFPSLRSFHSSRAEGAE